MFYSVLGFFLNFCKCALSSLISLSSKYWGRGEEKNWSLYVQKEKKFSLCQCVPAKGHFLLTFYCLFFLEECVSKAPSAAKLSAASLFRAADVKRKSSLMQLSLTPGNSLQFPLPALFPLSEE